jgi:hypothetical protein
MENYPGHEPLENVEARRDPTRARLVTAGLRHIEPHETSSSNRGRPGPQCCPLERVSRLGRG